jgi:RNA polymerase sigma factor (sigma-70 family)
VPDIPTEVERLARSAFWKWTGTGIEQEDVYQSAVLGWLEGFSRASGPGREYIAMRQARREIIDLVRKATSWNYYIRRRSAKFMSLDAEPVQGSGAMLIDDDAPGWTEVDHALERLRPAERELLQMRIDSTTKRISEEIGASISQIDRQIREIRRRIGL